MTLRVAVVGAGDHSRRHHGPALRDCAERRSDLELAAVCDLDADRAERYAASFGFGTAYREVDRMIDAERPDALVVVSPVEATRDLVGRAFEYGRPVLLEKPPGRDADETRALLSLALERGVPHAVSFNRRFDPAVVRAVDWLADRSDHPRRCVARLHRVDRLEPEHVRWTGVHAVDLALSFLSRPVAVTSRRWQSRDAGGQSCEARVDCADGDAAVVLLAPDAGRRAETYELVGPGYSVEVDVDGCRFRAFEDGAEVAAWECDDDAPPHVRSGALAETEAFLDAVRAGTGFAPTLYDGLRAMRTVEAIAAGGERALSSPDSPGDGR